MLILPILIVGIGTGAELIRNQPYDSTWTLAAFYSAIVGLCGLYLTARKFDWAVFPASIVALGVTAAVIIGRIVEVNFGTFRQQSGDSSVFIAIYAYIPIIYLFGYMLFSRVAALIFSLITWLVVGLIVYAANIEELAKPEWREGLNYLILILGMGHPVFILLVYQVPPYAEAVNKAKVETHEVKEALDSMEQLAQVDTLTGLSNRRFLSTFWDSFANGSSYKPHYLSLFVVDIDYFKSFNDAVGHIEGDKCLKTISAELHTFANDYGGHAVRYGGEEFLILVPSEVKLDPMSLAEQIRYSVQDLKIPHPAHEGRFVSVSVGATFGESASDSSESNWMRAADAALYDAKNAGRNCSTVRSLSRGG